MARRLRAALLCALPACSSGNAGDRGAGGACADDADCAEGLVCFQGVCTEPGDGGSERPPRLLLEPDEIDFGAPLLGVEVERTLTAVNAGGSRLAIERLDLAEEGDVDEYATDPAAGVALDVGIEPGAESEIRVVLRATDLEADLGTLCVRSNDPEDPVQCVRLISDIKGDPVLCANALEDGGAEDPLGSCDPDEVVAFPAVPAGESAERIVVFYNGGDGNRPIEIVAASDLYVTDDAGDGPEPFTLEAFVDATLDVPAEFPLRLDPRSEDGAVAPDLLYARLLFAPEPIGLVADEDLCADYVRHVRKPEELTLCLPIVAASEGCPDGFADLDGDPDNGCECAVFVETCNSADDDCDGDVDEDFGLGAPCDGTDADLCDEGLVTCAGCSDATGDAVEICNSADDDCDGDVDEGCCVPALETCNGADDDCDGLVDEGIDEGCGPCVGWTATWGAAPGGLMYPRSAARADDGSVLVSGIWSGSAVDFDPGPGVDARSSTGFNDGFVSRLGPGGAYEWAATWGGAGGNDDAMAVALAADGSAFVAGGFTSTTDVDPGPGIDDRTPASAGTWDVLLLKLGSDGAYDWAATFGGTGDDLANAVATAPDGSAVVAGWFEGSVDFDPGAGTDTQSAGGSRGGFVTSLGADGSYGFTRTWSGFTEVHAVAVAADGTIFVGGDFTGTVDFDPGPATDTRTAVSGSAFVIALDAAGAYLWGAVFEGGSSIVQTLATTADGVVAGGVWNGTVDFDPGAGSDTRTYAGGIGTWDAFAAKLDAGGAAMWARTFGGTDYDVVESVAVAADGSLRVAGYFAGTVDLDPGAGTDSRTATGSSEAFVSSFLSDGSFAGVTTWPATGSSLAAGAAPGLDGSVAVAGAFVGTVDFSLGAGTDSRTSIGSDVFVTNLCAPPAPVVEVCNGVDDDGDGLIDEGCAACGLFTATFGGSGGTETPSGLATAPDGSILVTGQFGGTVDFMPGSGVDERTSAGDWDSFLAKLDTDGSYLWAATWGSTWYEIPYDVAAGADGAAYVTGFFYWSTDLDPGPLADTRSASGTGWDVFLSRIEPDGSYGWGATWGASGTTQSMGYAVATTPDGAVVVAGRLGGEGSIIPAEPTSAFLKKLDAGGTVLWELAWGGPGSAEAWEVAAAADGSILAVGPFYESADLDPGPGIDERTSAGERDVFLSRFDAAGSRLWTVTWGGAADDWGQAVAAADDGSALVVGTFQGTVDFDPGAGDASLTSAGGWDAYASKLGADGTLEWTWTMGAAPDDSCIAAAVAPDSSWRVAGSSYGAALGDPWSAWVVRLEADGAATSTQVLEGTASGSASAADLATDVAGATVLLGGLYGTVDFDMGAGTDERTSDGTSDVFVAKLCDASGLGVETCNGIDDDGDGLIDEDLPTCGESCADPIWIDTPGSATVDTCGMADDVTTGCTDTAGPDAAIAFAPPAGSWMTIDVTLSGPVWASLSVGGCPWVGGAACDITGDGTIGLGPVSGDVQYIVIYGAAPGDCGAATISADW